MEAASSRVARLPVATRNVRWRTTPRARMDKTVAITLPTMSRSGRALARGRQEFFLETIQND
jgi:hypothetical protein